MDVVENRLPKGYDDYQFFYKHVFIKYFFYEIHSHSIFSIHFTKWLTENKEQNMFCYVFAFYALKLVKIADLSVFVMP